jgi:glucose/arabinose dehydrogenase
MKKRNQIILIVLSVLVVSAIAYWVWSTVRKESNLSNIDTNQLDQTISTEDGDITVNTLISGLDHPWDIKIAADQTIYFTQRQSGLYKYGKDVEAIYLPNDLYTSGEGGMLGFDLAPDFDTTREVYVCFNSNLESRGLNVIVSKLTLNASFDSVDERSDIITDISSSNSGRHSGCRVRFDPNNSNIIWVTTGDAADGSNPQDPTSLNGKVLRVGRDGNGVEGNLDGDFDSRIFSYGHRNLQGLTLFSKYDDSYGYGLTAEHGPDRDDEINTILKGNFGWDPNLPYDESVPMTDLDKYPDAIEALWSSGRPTVATSGIEYIKTGPWQGDVLLAALKANFIERFTLDSNGLTSQGKVITDYGRIRQVYQSTDGRIFFTTDNGGNDIVGEIILK